MNGKAKPLVIAVGLLLIAMGVLGFFAASVALARVQQVPVANLESPGRFELDPEDPLVHRRRQQAETVLFGSLLVGAAGLVTTLVGWRMRSHGA